MGARACVEVSEWFCTHVGFLSPSLTAVLPLVCLLFHPRCWLEVPGCDGLSVGFWGGMCAVVPSGALVCPALAPLSTAPRVRLLGTVMNDLFLVQRRAPCVRES